MGNSSILVEESILENQLLQLTLLWACAVAIHFCNHNYVCITFSSCLELALWQYPTFPGHNFSILNTQRELIATTCDINLIMSMFVIILYYCPQRSNNVLHDSEYCSWAQLLHPKGAEGANCNCTTATAAKLVFAGCELPPVSPQAYHK